MSEKELFSYNIAGKTEEEIQDVASALALEHILVRAPRTEIGADNIVRAIWYFSSKADKETLKKNISYLSDKEQEDVVLVMKDQLTIFLKIVDEFYGDDPKFGAMVLQKFRDQLSEILGRPIDFTLH